VVDVQSLTSPAVVASAAAAHIASCAMQAIAERGRFTLALSGGSTPWLMLNHLARMDLPWDRFHIVQVDERVAPDGDAERNLTHIQAQFTSRAGIPPGQVYAMPVLEDNLDAAANSYMHTLSGLAGIPAILDLVHLGLGGDGHTASLFSEKDLELGRGVYAVAISRDEKPDRISVTPDLLKCFEALIFLVVGSGKGDIVNHLLKDPTLVTAGLAVRDAPSVQLWQA
jgi:6-phosphogluconolactonase